MSYIYKIINTENQHIYIGKTDRTVEERWKEHLKDCNRTNFGNRPLYRAINKYGKDKFLIEQIEECSFDEAAEREKYWIEYYGSFKNGYNATIGGDGKPYIDYDLVIATYKELKSIVDTAKKLNICEDSVKNILESKKEKIYSSEEVIKNKYGKPVNMFDLKDNYIQTFPSLREAGQFLIDNNLSKCKLSTIKQHISEVCRGKRKTAAKFKWKFVVNE